MPQSKKKTKAIKKKRPRSSRATWSEGERRVDREAAAAGVKPVYDFASLPHVSPKDGEELLSAIHEMRELERRGVAQREKEKKKRAPKRA